MLRRDFIGASGALLVGAGLVSGRTKAAAIPEASRMAEATTQAPLIPSSGPDYNPVVTLNGWTCRGA
ncbi:hypothetical protein GMJLKIPL_6390 [Methylobacterium isbiliense]|mgnify:CR=1 FL=1|jgi:hypothetical protein|uniref:Uncharacterized protein n=1 Tax=Methylobacterium isbiliense TaxID=315478 RepID=A0ABQ4SQ66_9HYPH|nr:hypothetical protein GMJLKIPL_6390 [Methylobacterium isbiliense]